MQRHGSVAERGNTYEVSDSEMFLKIFLMQYKISFEQIRLSSHLSRAFGTWQWDMYRRDEILRYLELSISDINLVKINLYKFYKNRDQVATISTKNMINFKISVNLIEPNFVNLRPRKALGIFNNNGTVLICQTFTEKIDMIYRIISPVWVLWKWMAWVSIIIT